MKIPDEAVEAAARAWLERSTMPGSWTLEGSVRAALEAAAPFIAAKALEEAADTFESLPMNTGIGLSTGTWDWFEMFPVDHIRARAAAVRGEG